MVTVPRMLQSLTRRSRQGVYHNSLILSTSSTHSSLGGYLSSQRQGVFASYYRCKSSSIYSARKNAIQQATTEASNIPDADWADHAQNMVPRQSLRPGLNEVMQKTNDGLSSILKDFNFEEHSNDRTYFSRQYISDEEVERWLHNYNIPPEQIQKCKSQQELKDLKRLFARQIRLECAIYDMAVEKHLSVRQDVGKLGRASQVNAAQNLVVGWMEPAISLIAKEQRDVLAGKRSLDSTIYGPALLLLDAKVLAALTINTMLNNCLMESKGIRFIKLALALGNIVQEHIAENKRKRKDEEKYFLSLVRGIQNDVFRKHMEDVYTTVGVWDKRLNLKVGAALIDFIQRSCYVPDRLLMAADKKAHGDIEMYNPERIPKKEQAFVHCYYYDRNRRSGMFKIHDTIFNLILNTDPGLNVLPWTARYLPMLVPPKRWENPNNGGYLKLHTKIMRQRDIVWQMDCVKRAPLNELFTTLNLLAEVPWVINHEILDVILRIWQEGGGFGDLPTREDYPLPTSKPEEEEDPEKRQALLKAHAKVRQRNRELHSLRCDTLYKLQVAQEFRNEKEIYFPYNLDFRGRVYPIPPNLNHLGSDMSRSLLLFRDRKPLGKDGLRWLKIHLANVFGVDKCPFDERVAFTESNLTKVFASASDPHGIGEAAWWKTAEYPFLALGVCFELKRALESPDPETYLSNIPVHQDGSCNGLQHYAALGRDLKGGEQVNLVPASRPGDVYIKVAEQVMNIVNRDANLEIPEDATPERKISLAHRKRCATFLLGTITRRVVKQTVMTSVYGVTFIGARKQIQARLQEANISNGSLSDEEMDQQIYDSSCYAAEITMESLRNLFTSARNIMEWLGDCASKVAEEGQLMSWITPLGLPVVQPYRRFGCQQVRTKVQHVLMVSTDHLPVSPGRQKTAFPPNFVHSLDSTHMLMTAKKCLEEDDIAFAAVHDSYWTHACSVETMNKRLREEFVRLYERPLLEDLLEQLELRFPTTKFRKIPKLGELQLRNVLQSEYFFN
ncbi:unnamed protein product [Albugo candida]|uniref:DNA-directed RNA polymerase n=3 Tax=Albugo candida TaxID=65357 RepID=A0A024GF63_9STRA|nr:unnamed protein product [Albugo candida]|eukprot:CCI44962.1 unnamed protein product [Albugo candida]